jgi:MoaA/NifB/PqqE/SkfB family radical SAM enzyme
MSDLWCPLAWINASVKTDGTITTCCHGQPVTSQSTGNIITKDTHTLEEAFYSKEFEAIRDNLSKGIKDSNCEKCWSLERQGIDSPRITEIKFGEYQDRKSQSAQLEILDISLGNQCNLKCRTCHAGDSSTWAREQWDLGDRTTDFKDFQKNIIRLERPRDAFVESIKNSSLATARELHFFGGEPFLMKSTWDIIDHARKQQLQDQLIISFNTNMTIWNEDTISLLDDFQGVDIAMSIDGVGSGFEYMRHPAKWKDVRNNIDKALSWRDRKPQKRNLIICCTISAYNVYYCDEVLDFAEQYGITFWANPVFDPNNFAVDNMPINVKQAVIDRLPNNTEINKVVNQMQSTVHNEERWRSFLDKVEKHDKYRSESFSQVFPEYWRLINDTKL